MIEASILENIKKYNQEHLLRYYETLSDEDKKKYEKQLEELDFTYVDLFNNKDNNCKEDKNVFEPLQAMKISEINQRKEEFKKAGIEALKKKMASGAKLLPNQLVMAKQAGEQIKVLSDITASDTWFND